MSVSNYYVPNKNNKPKLLQNDEKKKEDQKWETFENVLDEYLIQYGIADSIKQNSNYIKLLGNLKVDDLAWEEFLDKQIISINGNLKDKEAI